MSEKEEEGGTEVREPEPGSWTERTPYVNPPEYAYYTYRLLERRVADEITRCVLSTFAEEKEAPRVRIIRRPRAHVQQ